MTRHASAPYAERLTITPGGFDLSAAQLAGHWQTRLAGVSRIGGLARRVEALAAQRAGKPDMALLAEAAELRASLSESFDALVPRVFSLVHIAVERNLGLRYHPVQLSGGAALTRRRIVEMATGEGKTITAVLPAAALALTGKPVHIVTVNDYLAERDANRLRPVFAALGLTVGLVREGDEPDARRAAYAADVTYVTNKELTFDYLKDRIATASARGLARHKVASLFGAAPRGLLLRGLYAAIIDEADSVLIDEARTPLIISAERKDPSMAEMAARALSIARSLDQRSDYIVDETSRTLLLTESGRAVIAERGSGFAGLFRARQAREQFVTQALTALRLFRRDEHYIVADGKVQIVDEYTGRIMQDRSWEQGLHQLIEAKEGVELTRTRETLSRITYQRFFNRYLHLCGMTGTAREVAGELRGVYGVRVVRLPPNRPVRRRHLGGTLTETADEKWARVGMRIEELARTGRPVLIGTQSVEGSEAMSAELGRRGIAHVVLNARQTEYEAEIISLAGQMRRVTVATNMAGRGTDIVLGPGVAEAGGLHVILTGYHDSSRIDRQLFGRAARQGDPGSCECIVSLDDELFQRFAPGLASTIRRGGPAARLIWKLLPLRAQSTASRAYARQRKEQILADDHFEKGLGFAGKE